MGGIVATKMESSAGSRGKPTYKPTLFDRASKRIATWSRSLLTNGGLGRRVGAGILAGIMSSVIGNAAMPAPSEKGIFEPQGSYLAPNTNTNPQTSSSSSPIPLSTSGPGAAQTSSGSSDGRMVAQNIVYTSNGTQVPAPSPESSVIKDQAALDALVQTLKEWLFSTEVSFSDGAMVFTKKADIKSNSVYIPKIQQNGNLLIGIFVISKSGKIGFIPSELYAKELDKATGGVVYPLLQELIKIDVLNQVTHFVVNASIDKTDGSVQFPYLLETIKTGETETTVQEMPVQFDRVLPIMSWNAEDVIVGISKNGGLILYVPDKPGIVVIGMTVKDGQVAPTSGYLEDFPSYDENRDVLVMNFDSPIPFTAIGRTEGGKTKIWFASFTGGTMFDTGHSYTLLKESMITMDAAATVFTSETGPVLCIIADTKEKKDPVSLISANEEFQKIVKTMK